MTRGAVRTQRLIAASRVSLWWERAWAASWRGLTVLGAGLALALFDVWAELPAGPRILALSALFIAAAAFFWLDWRAVFWPSREAGLRALEDANGLVHRPLSAAEDALAAGQGDPLTEALWRRHVARQLAAYAKLEPVWPKPGVPVRDPYAVRGAVFLALVAGFAVAGSDAPSRIASAFSTEEAKGALAPGVALDAWITPPAYTGLAPIILAQSKATVPLEADRQIAVPIGSKLTLRLDGTTSPSVQRIPLDGGDSAELVPEGAAANGSFTTELELTGSERLRVQAGGRKAGDWEITVLPDAPPSIAFDGELAATPRQATRVPFKAGDDYGVAAAEAQIRLAPEAQEGDDPTAEEGEDVIVMKLPVNGGDGKALKNAAFEDLTAHPWAGLEVVVQLVATDATGQTGHSPEQRFTLPERTFKDPLARAIVEQRKNLSRGPGAIPGVTHPGARALQHEGSGLSRPALGLLAADPVAGAQGRHRRPGPAVGHRAVDRGWRRHTGGRRGPAAAEGIAGGARPQCARRGDRPAHRGTAPGDARDDERDGQVRPGRDDPVRGRRKH
jgi:uncharacterized protein (TIGR02302 family)